jgi:hypothetical protein
MVTVDSSSSRNVIVWEKLDKFATDSFFIYREITTNNYQEIAATGRDSLSQYEDSSANPVVTAYRYKMATKDTCGNSGVLSPYHNTIHLQYLGNGNLVWNAYEIENQTTPIISYDVYRDSTGTGNWTLMVTVPGTQTTATDVNFSTNPNSQYRIKANWINTCTPSRSAYDGVFSNIITQSSVNGIASINREGIMLYPNPASTLLYLDAPGFEKGMLNFYNIQGQQVLIQKFAHQIDIRHLNSGVYFIEIKNGGTVEQKMFLKE